MSKLESIKRRRQEYLDSIRKYIEGEHEEKRDEFLYFAEQDIEYILQRLEHYETVLKKIEVSETHLQAKFFAKEALKE